MKNKVSPKKGLPLVWNRRVEPEKYPDFAERSVQPVTWENLDNRFHAMALRGFHVNDEGVCDRYRQEIDWYVNKLGLGDILWMNWCFLKAKNFREVIRYIAEQGLWLFDIWGYLPTGQSRDGNPWVEFRSYATPSGNAHEFITRTLGSKFLGWDNGEQDGRYLGHYGRTFCPTAFNKLQAYEHFVGYFHRLSNHMSNYLTVLLGLYHAHYMLHLDNHRLIGAETAQHLPSVPPWFAFIRGAGKQYGVLWFGNASIWNRWGYKRYDKSGSGGWYEFGPDKGTSLSLLKRLWYVHLVYGCCMMGYESGHLMEDHPEAMLAGEEKEGAKAKLSLSPIGELQAEGIKWQEAHPDLGVQYTPVALLLDFYQGWTPARSSYGGPYISWGDMSYSLGDHQIDAFFRCIYPGYEDAGFYHDERGFLTDTPVGDIFDVLLSNAKEDILTQYRAVITLGDIVLEGRLLEKVLRYVKAGGRLITWKEHLGEEAQEILKRLGLSKLTEAKQLVYGKGIVVFLGNNRGIVRKGKIPEGLINYGSKYEAEKPFPPAYVLKPEIRKALLAGLEQYALVEVKGSPIQIITNLTKRDNELLVTLVNNHPKEWEGSLKLSQGQLVEAENLFTDQSLSLERGTLKVKIPALEVGIWQLKSKSPVVQFMKPQNTAKSSVPRIAVWSLARPELVLRENIHCVGITRADSIQIEVGQVFNLTNDELKVVREHCSAHDLKIVALNLVTSQTPYIDNNLGSELPHVLEETRSFLGRSLEIARILETKTVIVSPGRLPEHGQNEKQAFKTTVSALYEFACAAAEHGLDILLNSHPHRFCSQAEDLRGLIEAIALENVGAALDLGHLSLVGEDLPEAVKVLSKHLRILQISSPEKRGFDTHSVPGEGKMSLGQVKEAVDTAVKLCSLEAIVLTCHFPKDSPLIEDTIIKRLFPGVDLDRL